MDFSNVIKARRSIRQYKTDSIPEDVYPRLHAALSLAPSGSNGQPCNFIFVKDPETRELLVTNGCHQNGFLNAPLIVVACCKEGREFDCAIAVDHLILAATNEGLGTCWVGWIQREEIRKLLGIPQDIEIPVIIPIGYADESPAPRARKPLNELIQVDAFRCI